MARTHGEGKIALTVQLQSNFSKSPSLIFWNSLNLLTPRCDEHISSPCDSTKLSCKEVIRTDRLISQRCPSGVSPNSPLWSTRKCNMAREENCQLDLGSQRVKTISTSMGLWVLNCQSQQFSLKSCWALLSKKIKELKMGVLHGSEF